MCRRRRCRFTCNRRALPKATSVTHNTYVNKTVINNATVNRASFNGSGGVEARPTAQEQRAEHESHVQATSEQTTHEHSASMDKSNFASQNHGKPATPAYSKVGVRAENQQKRIGNGVESGKMTAGKTAHVEKQEPHINHQV